MNQGTFNGNPVVLSLFDRDLGGGNRVQAKIENFSSGAVTLNLPITFAATEGPNWGEINAVNGIISFGSGHTLTVMAVAWRASVSGGSGGISTTFLGTVSASGKYFATSSVGHTVSIGGAFTSGDFYLMNAATLNLLSAGSFATSALRLGGDFGTTGTQNQSFGATFALTGSGQSFSS